MKCVESVENVSNFQIVNGWTVSDVMCEGKKYNQSFFHHYFVISIGLCRCSRFSFFAYISHPLTLISLSVD